MFFQPIEDISKTIRSQNKTRLSQKLPTILIHTDAAQAIGKIKVDVEELGVDYLTIVGHKFYGPRIGMNKNKANVANLLKDFRYLDF